MTKRAGQGTALAPREETKTPRRYKVFLHNDNYTTMDFVVAILMDVFRKDKDEAARIMLDVHENGIGLAGVFIKAVAEAKVLTVHQRARNEGYPLRCEMEPE